MFKTNAKIGFCFSEFCSKMISKISIIFSGDEVVESLDIKLPPDQISPPFVPFDDLLLEKEKGYGVKVGFENLKIRTSFENSKFQFRNFNSENLNSKFEFSLVALEIFFYKHFKNDLFPQKNKPRSSSNITTNTQTALPSEERIDCGWSTAWWIGWLIWTTWLRWEFFWWKRKDFEWKN